MAPSLRNRKPSRKSSPESEKPRGRRSQIGLKAKLVVPRLPQPKKAKHVRRVTGKVLETRNPDEESSKGGKEEEDIEAKVQEVCIGVKEKRKLLARHGKAPDRIFKVTKARFENAMQILNADVPPPPDFRCTHSALLVNKRSLSHDYLMSDNWMFQELRNCLERGDLDGFVKTAIAAHGTRKNRPDLKNDIVCAALTALFYHPAANDPAIFQMCIESLFNTKRSKLGTADEIVKSFMGAFSDISSTSD